MSTTAQGQTYGSTFSGNAAENYERFFVPVIGRPLAIDLIDNAKLREGDRVLDVGCGTGIVARLAADRVGTTGSVAGADVTAGMLSVARTAAGGTRVPVQWYETSAEAMPLPDESYDAVFCQLALMFIPDKIAALREMRRVLVDGGRAYASVPGPSSFFDVLHDAFERQSLPDAAAFVRAVFSLHDSHELERLFHAAGFGDVSVRAVNKQVRLPAAKDFFWQYVHCTPLAAEVDRLDDRIRASIERAVVGGWQAWTDDQGMTYAQPMLIATARK